MNTLGKKKKDKLAIREIWSIFDVGPSIQGHMCDLHAIGNHCAKYEKNNNKKQQHQIYKQRDSRYQP